jgi:class 3 adenylate cyclase
MSAGAPPGTAPADPLAAGRAAIDRHDWPEAFERLSEADAATPLSADDLELLAMAAFFVARADLEIELTERAFRLREAAGDAVRATFLAVQVARKLFYAGKPSIASGWIRRAQRIAGNDGDSYAHGYLAIAASEAAAARGDVEGAVQAAERAIAIAVATGDPDLGAHARSNLGSLMIATGDPTEGVALMEEASIAAVNGELSPFTSGVTACRMIGACRDLTDYRRASEWIEATERYCDRQALEAFPGVCRIHRAEVAAVSGAWDRAQTDLQRAMIELEGFNTTPPQADGYYALGDILRRKGDWAGAEDALREAHVRGRTPQPALALVRLAQGQVGAARAAIDAAVADETFDRWARARLLSGQVEILLVAGDIGGARAAADELAAIVTAYPSPALKAGADVALGRVAAAEGDLAGAARSLRLGIRGWRDVGAPYEIARARTVLARVTRAQGADDDADLELRAALDAFRELGAAPDVAAVERDLRDAEDRRSGPPTARQTFLFTDIVGSTNLAEALGDEAWAGLLRWHDEMLRTHVERGGGRVVNSTGDGIFAAFATARAALDAAIAIQRALREQRTTSGFAPSVRIGIHTGEATRKGDDYSGMAVHLAARIGALAGGGEILASSETLAEAGETPATEPRTVTVKGVSTPVVVAGIDWAAGR